MTTVYIVRHCESMANLNHSFAGHYDVDISPKGAKQLACLTERFKDIRLDKVYSSHLKRAYKTAEAVNKYNGCEIIIDDSFIEMNFGVIDGKPVKDMTEEQTYCWNNEPHKFRVPEGETMAQVAARVWEGLQRVVRDNPNSTIAIASHGCAVRNLMRVLKGLAEERITEVEWCDNTAINKVEFYDDGSYKLVAENDSSHLTDEAKAEPIGNWNWSEK